MSIKDIVYALIVNIALLAIIANLLSRIQTVQKLILQEKRGLKGDLAYSVRTAHPFRRNGAPFRFKLSKAQQVD